MSRGFRVWDNQAKSYDCDREFVLSPNGNLMELCSNHNGIWDYHFADEDRFIVERDTGLKDANGKRICEGDIVKVTKWVYDENLGHEEIVHITKISWWGRYAQFGTDYSDNLSDEITEDFYEVIGNIHENKELLEN